MSIQWFPCAVKTNRPTLVLWISVLALAGCNAKPEAERKPPPTTVVVIKAQRTNVPIMVSTNGTTRSLNEVTIRARVKGFLKEKFFDEGANVKAGQLLFVIDEAPFQVQLEQAQANLAKADAALQRAEQSKAQDISRAQLRLDEAQLQLTVLEERRQAELLGRKAVSKSDYDQADANRKKAAAQVDADKANTQQADSNFKTSILAAKAEVETAKAETRNAEIELGYCRMSAPIAGRIGEIQVKLGNLVGGDESTELATIQQLDPMGVDLRSSARNLPEITALVKKGLMFTIRIQGDHVHPYPAKAFFVDNRIDPGTSTVLIKAEVPNPDESILPGGYVQASANIGEYKDAIVVPEKAVMEGQAGSTVYVVDAESRVAVANVKPVDTYQGLRVIESGLEPGQQVIIEGFQLVRPGMVVKAEEANLEIPRGPEKTPAAKQAKKPR